MKKVLTLSLVGLLLTTSSQTILKDNYLKSQTVVNGFWYSQPTTGLFDVLAYYPFSGNANDESGNGFNGTATNAVLTTGRKGGGNEAYDFSALNSRIGTSLNLGGAKKISFSAWVYIPTGLTAGVDCYIVCQDNRTITGTRDINFYVRRFTSTPDFLRIYLYPFKDGSNLFATHADTTFADIDNKWIHIVATHDFSNPGDSVKIYVDGVKATIDGVSKVGTVSSIGNSTTMSIGGRLNGEMYFRGDIDDVRVDTSTVWTPSQVLQLYNE